VLTVRSTQSARSNNSQGRGVNLPSLFIMNIIIPNFKKYSDGEIDRALMQEIKNGFALERKTEAQRVKAIAADVSKMKGSTHPSLGKPVASMPAREFFRLTSKYGHDEVHSNEFLKDYNKRFSHMCANKI